MVKCIVTLSELKLPLNCCDVRRRAHLVIKDRRVVMWGKVNICCLTKNQYVKFSSCGLSRKQNSGKPDDSDLRQRLAVRQPSERKK